MIGEAITWRPASCQVACSIDNQHRELPLNRSRCATSALAPITAIRASILACAAAAACLFPPVLLAAKPASAVAPAQLVEPPGLTNFERQMVDEASIAFVKGAEPPSDRPLTRDSLKEVYAEFAKHGLQITKFHAPWVDTKEVVYIEFKPATQSWRIKKIGENLTRRYPELFSAVVGNNLFEGIVRPAPQHPTPDSTVDAPAPNDGESKPNDPRFIEQWNLFEDKGGSNLPGAWSLSSGEGVVVAVIDSGVRHHADLKANLLPGYDFIAHLADGNDGDGRDADPRDPGDWRTEDTCSGQPARNSTWHGTVVAGIVGAVSNNNRDIAGVAPKAKLLPARVIGRCGARDQDVADAIRWSVGGQVGGVPENPTPAQVINLSFDAIGTCAPPIQRAIDIANTKGAVVVTIAGNSGADASKVYPANCKGVVVVAATNRQGGKTDYTNTGDVVSLAAPGGVCAGNPPLCGSDGVMSTSNTGDTDPASDFVQYESGTSVAAPQVAGVVALMKELRPSLTPEEARSILVNTAREFNKNCNGCGSGILDGTAAVQAVSTKSDLMSEAEPNGSAKKANRVAGNAVRVNARIGKVDGEDWYVLNLPAAAAWTSTLTPNSQSNFDLYIYDENKNLVASSTRSGHGEVDAVSLTNDSGAASDFYAVVRFVDAPTGAYTLDLKVRPTLTHARRLR